MEKRFDPTVVLIAVFALALILLGYAGVWLQPVRVLAGSVGVQ